MARKTIRILTGGNNKKDYWCYWSVPVSTVNTTIKNSEIPPNANISRVGMYARADYDGGSLSTKEIYLQFGFGNSTNSISKFLQNDIIIDDDPNGLYPSSEGVDVTGYFNKNTLEFSQSNGAYLVFCVHTDNWSVKEQTFSEAFVVIDYTEHTHSYTTETARTPSTCYTKGSVTKKCSCGVTQKTELALDPNNHAGGTEIKNAKAATCTATGYTGDTYCKGCGVKIASGSTIAKKAHSEITMPAVAPTCTETGLTEGKKCSVCGTVITAQNTVNALGHSYVDYITPPTDDSRGYTAHICSRCNDTYIDTYVHRIKALSNNSGYGTAIGSGDYDYGKTITLTAIPTKDCVFMGWNDGVKDASRNIAVTYNTTYTAYFKLIAIRVDTSQSSGVLIDKEEASEIVVDKIKVYDRGGV